MSRTFMPRGAEEGNAGTGAHSTVQDEINAGTAEMICGICCYGSVKGAEDVVMAIYLADGDVRALHSRKVSDHVLKDLHTESRIQQTPEGSTRQLH